MSGYGMRDSSVLVRAIGDYANYVESKRRYDLDRQRQLDRDREMDERWETENARAQEAHNASMAEVKYQQQKRDTQRENAEALVDSYKLGMSGDETEIVDQGNGYSSVVTRHEDGSITPLNAKADDPSSPQVVVKNEDIPAVQANIDQATADVQDMPQQYQSAYLRAMIPVSEAGQVEPRLATEQEFKENLQPWLGNYGDTTKIEAEVNAAKNKASNFFSVDHIGEAYGKQGGGGDLVKKGMKAIYDGATYFPRKSGKALIDAGKAAAWWFGPSEAPKVVEDNIKVDNNGQARVKGTGRNPQGVIDAKAEMDKAAQQGNAPEGYKQTPTTETTTTAQVVAQIPQIQLGRKVTPRLAKVYGNMYINGELTTQQYQNVMETGFLEYNKLDLQDKALALGVKQTSITRNMSAAAHSRAKYIKEVNGDPSKKAEARRKLADDALKRWKDLGEDIVTAQFGDDGEQASANLSRLLTNTLAVQQFSDEQLMSEQFDAAIGEAMQLYATMERFGKGYDGSSLSALMNTGGKLGIDTTQHIIKLGRAVQQLDPENFDERSMAGITSRFNDELAAFRQESGGIEPDAETIAAISAELLKEYTGAQ